MKTFTLTTLTTVIALAVTLTSSSAEAGGRIRLRVGGRSHDRAPDAVVIQPPVRGHPRVVLEHPDTSRGHSRRGSYDRGCDVDTRHGRRGGRAPDAVVIQPPVRGHPPVVIEHPRSEPRGYIRPIYRGRGRHARRMPYCGERIPLRRVGRSGGTHLSFSIGW